MIIALDMVNQMFHMLANTAPNVLEYTDQTNLHPLGLVAILVLGAFMLLLPRRWAPVPMLLLACFISPAQRVAIAQIDFDLLRIMVVFGVVRILVRGEAKQFQFHRLDGVVLAWAAVATLMFTMLYGSMAALINRLGMVFDAAGMYLLFRVLVRDWEDVCAFAKAIAFVSIPVAAAFTVEYFTRYNMFSVFGRVPEITEIRQGKIRCQGAFPHPIIAGCFWASVMPLVVGLWWAKPKFKWLAVVGAVCCLWIIFTTASSTPVGAMLAGVVAACMFPARFWMRSVRWAIVVGLVVAHFTMNGPVWSIFAKLDLVGGSTGYHRFNLIDKGISRFGEWWMMGTKSTAHWGWSMFDITNHYLLEGIRGGLATLLLFIAIIVVAFSDLGKVRKKVEGNLPLTAMTWAMGVALFVHVTNFFGIAYFGQISVAWYSILALCGSMAVAAKAGQPRPAMVRRMVPPNQTQIYGRPATGVAMQGNS